MDTLYGELLTIEARIAWPQLGLTDAEIEKKKAKRKGKNKKFKDKKNNITVLIRKKDKATLQAIKDACIATAQVKSVDDLSKWPLVDKEGDYYDGDEHSEMEGYAGCFFFKTGTDKEMDFYMLDEDGDGPIPVPFNDIKKVFYPGANCAIIVQPAAMEGDDEETVQVAFYLQGIMRLDAEGKRLGDSVNTRGIFQKYAKKSAAVESDEEDEDDAPVAKKSKKSKPAPVEVEDDEDEDDAPPPPKKSKSKPAPVEVEDDSDDEDEDDAPPPPKKKSKPVVEESEDDDDGDDTPPPPKKNVKKNKADITSILD